MTDQFFSNNIPPSGFNFLKTKLTLVLIGVAIVMGLEKYAGDKKVEAFIAKMKYEAELY